MEFDMYLKSLYRHLTEPKIKVCLMLCIFMIALGAIGANGQESSEKVLQNKIFTLKHLPAHQAKKFLGDLAIGRDMSCMFNDTVLVFTTDNAADMEKASSILKVIDSKTKYSTAAVAVKPGANTVTGLSEIDGVFDSFAAGTFKHPPFTIDGTAAIVDMHRSNLIVIAPLVKMKAIKTSIHKSWMEGMLVKGAAVKTIENHQELESFSAPH